MKTVNNFLKMFSILKFCYTFKSHLKKSYINMVKNYIVTQILICFFVFHSFAQYEEEEYISKLPSIGAGVGVLSYFGELQKTYNIGTLTHIRPGYHLTVEQRLGNFIGLQLTGLMGKVAHSQFQNNRLINFESPITQVGLDLVFHFDNDKIINRKSLFTPFLSIGAGYMMFDPRGDYKDKNGNEYYIWSNGSIMNLPESDSTYFIATPISRDYKYETKLTDSTNNYPRNTIVIPITGGLDFRLSRTINVKISGTYCLTQTDYLDNTKADGKNDSYLYTNVSLHYQLGANKALKQKEAIYKDVNFSNLEKMDSDGDGIKDIDDLCQNTPKGVKVDKNGCPLDSDGDGVPDHLDKEPNTLKGAAVDADGVALTETKLQEMMAKEELSTLRENVFKENPSLATLMKIGEEQQQKRRSFTGANTGSSKIPAEFQVADLNGDGYISAEEIAKNIDMFFEGESTLTVEKLHKLIDFFFEQ
jgi:hypothetical protein